MPTLARWFIKTALIYMVLALLLGAALLANQGLQLAWLSPTWIPIYFHGFMVGWVTQLIFGVAWWMFPLQPGAFPRGRESWAWGLYGCLNGGLLLRALAEPQLPTTNPVFISALVLSVFLQATSGLLYVTLLWPRVRMRERKKTL